MLKICLLKDLIKKEAVDFVALQETFIVGDASTIVNAFWTRGDFGFCHIEAEGRSGGILSS